MTEAQDYKERRWLALGLLCVAQFIVVLDASIVNVALPSIGEALNFSEANLSWIVNAYVLTFGGFLLLGGRMADLLVRRRVFMAGLLLVAVASGHRAESFDAGHWLVDEIKKRVPVWKKEVWEDGEAWIEGPESLGMQQAPAGMREV